MLAPSPLPWSPRWGLGRFLPLTIGLSGLLSFIFLSRARAPLQQHNPGNARVGGVRDVALGERDLELLINHGSQRLGDVRSRVRLQPGVAVVQVSLGLVDTPWGRWLNLQAVLRQVQADALLALLQ